MSHQLLLSFALCFVGCLPSLWGQTYFNRSIGLPHYTAHLSPPFADGSFLVAAGDDQSTPLAGLVVHNIATTGPTQAAWQLSTTPALAYMAPHCVARLADGRIAVAGSGRRNQASLGWVCMLDSSGQGIAANEIDFGKSAEWFDIAATPDSGFVVSGYGRAPSGGGGPSTISSLIARYDKHLNLIWAHALGSPNQNLFTHSVVALPSGNFMLGGRLATTTGGTETVVAHLDAGGNLTWAKSYPAPIPMTLEVRAMRYDGQDKLYLSSTALMFNPHYQMCLLAIDTAGNFLWGKGVQDNQGTDNLNLVAGPGGTWILHGYKAGGAYADGMSAAFSSSGSLLWSRKSRFGIDHEAVADVVPHPDGSYVWLLDELPRKRIIRTDAQGLMPLSCGPIPYYVATSPIQLSGAFITLNRLPGPTNAPLAVTPTKIAVSNYADCTPIAAEQARATFAVRVLPQPMRSSARILLAEGSLADDAQLHITDLSGRSLALPATRLHDGWEIQRGGLPAGIYAYQVLQDGQRIASGKLWVAD